MECAFDLYIVLLGIVGERARFVHPALERPSVPPRVGDVVAGKGAGTQFSALVFRRGRRTRLIECPLLQYKPAEPA